MEIRVQGKKKQCKYATTIKEEYSNIYVYVIFLKVNDGIKLGCLIPWATSENLYNG